MVCLPPFMPHAWLSVTKRYLTPLRCLLSAQMKYSCQFLRGYDPHRGRASTRANHWSKVSAGRILGLVRFINPAVDRPVDERHIPRHAGRRDSTGPLPRSCLIPTRPLTVVGAYIELTLHSHAPDPGGCAGSLAIVAQWRDAQVTGRDDAAQFVLGKTHRFHFHLHLHPSPLGSLGELLVQRRLGTRSRICFALLRQPLRQLAQLRGAQANVHADAD